jgi:hypothetical protein
MKLTLLGKEADDGESPTLYLTDRDTYVVQGWRVADPEALTTMALPAHETAVEVPSALMRFLRSGGNR